MGLGLVMDLQRGGKAMAVGLVCSSFTAGIWMPMEKF